jgi:hypothetical protein
MSLEPAPDTPVTGAGVEFGSYRGPCVSTDLAFGSRVGRFARMRHEKRWQWFCVGDDTLALGGAIVDTGPTGIGSLWVFDREASEMLVDTSLLIPPFMVRIDDNPTAATVATGRSIGCRLSVGWRGDRVHVSGHIGDAKLTLGYDTTAADPVTAVCPVTDGLPESVTITQKSACLPVSGVVTADGLHHRLDEEAVGMLDYSHGLLGRERTWQWAVGSGHDSAGTPIGFNVSEGINEGLENVVWVRGVPRAIGSANIESDETNAEYHIETADGELSVTLDIEDVRQEDIGFGFVDWENHRPFGRWYGTICGREVEGIYGSAGTNHVKW